MAPTSAYMVQTEYEEPISRTYQYRKVMKPMLERKRRARINRCLDELKELMVTALQSEGENVSKLEKADILELTVRHLHQLKRQHQLISTPEQSYADRFRAGFTHCATEVSHFLSTPKETVDPIASAKLLQHLGTCIRRLENGMQQQQMMQPQQPQQQSPQQMNQQYYQTQQLPIQQVQVQQYTPPTSPVMLMQQQTQQIKKYQPKLMKYTNQQCCSLVANKPMNVATTAPQAPMWRPW
ncbi:enhancer of split mbeta protein-like [Chrysoperla carnea]|uniref:enhancer of split mbeta protein-like n=1 Tax=Chrysoperla carnea TaxID=189513 RepID=UPI001D0935D4|nr:enhancer of split mbeta protein-like [Chrysoperla carnea]